MSELERFDKDQLKKRLASLVPWKRVAFMLLCCTRMIPNYRSFSAETGFGNTQKLWQATQLAWTWIASDLAPANLGKTRTEVESLTPDTEDFSSPLTSAALDAACAVAYVLDAVEAASGPATVDLAVEVGGLAFDSIDLFVQEVGNLSPNQPGFEGAVLRHPLMQAELRQQREDIGRLERWAKTRREAVEELQIGSADDLLGSLQQQAT